MFSDKWIIEEYNSDVGISKEFTHDGHRIVVSLVDRKNVNTDMLCPTVVISFPDLQEKHRVGVTVSVDSKKPLRGNKDLKIFENEREIELMMPFGKESLFSDDYLVDGKLILMFDINFFPYDHIPYSGLVNQGATCYMNSMLQSLFHIPSFRRIVYHMPTTGTEDVEKSIPLNLQRLFCMMQLSEKPCSTDDLTKSFGWGSYETIMQHDIQEFCRVLMDNLETKMKGTELEGRIAKLFKGKYRNYIRCLNVDYESNNDQEFYDLQMLVKDCPNLEKSFEKYIEKELLNGKNQYQTDKFGKQDAEMGIEFLEFPPVLQLHLRRFEYDFNYDSMVKIDDRFEYPKTIDLSPYLAKSIDNQKSNVYELCGVLIHSGGVNGGHYYSYLRTTTSDKWYKFDDESVTLSNEQSVFENNFGGVSESSKSYSYYSRGRKQMKYYSAYILVYVRQDDIEEIFAPISKEDVPSYLVEYFNVQDEKNRKKEAQKKSDEHNALISLYTEQDLAILCKDSKLGFKRKPHPEVIRILKTKTNFELYSLIAQTLNVDESSIRIWKTGFYNNPTKVIMPSSNLVLSHLSYDNEMSLFVQKIDINENKKIEEGYIVIYAKFFIYNDPVPFKYLGSFTVSSLDEVKALYPVICSKVGIDSEVSLLTFMETTQGSMKNINENLSYYNQNIETGCLLVFQINPASPIEIGPVKEFCVFSDIPRESEEESSTRDFQQPKKESEEDANLTVYSLSSVFPEYKVDTVESYINHRDHLKKIIIASYDDPTNHLFKIEIPLTISPQKILLMISKLTNEQCDMKTDSFLLYKPDFNNPKIPASQPMDLNYSLQFAFSYSSETPVLFYQILKGISAEQLKTMSLFSVNYSSNGIIVDKSDKILLDKKSTCKQILEGFFINNPELRTDGEFRFYQIYSMSFNLPIDPDSRPNYSSWPIRIDHIPEDQLSLLPKHFLMTIRTSFIDSYGYECDYHLFWFIIRPEETYLELKQRIAEALKIEWEKFKEFKITLKSSGYNAYETAVKDDDVFCEIANKEKVLSINIGKKKNKYAMENSSVKIYN